jgi:succinate dehydrogenase / fumarate reductase cytochrome b subunit
MIVSGSVVWHFGIAFLRFWVPEMVYKYVDVSPLNETRYFHELAEKFESPIRTGLYSYHFYYYHCTCGTGSVLLQSVGFNNKYSRS